MAMLLSRSIVHRLPTSVETALLPDKLRSVVGGGVEAGIQRLLEHTAPGVAQNHGLTDVDTEFASQSIFVRKQRLHVILAG